MLVCSRPRRGVSLWGSTSSEEISRAPRASAGSRLWQSFCSGRARRNRPCCSVWRKKYLPGPFHALKLGVPFCCVRQALEEREGVVAVGPPVSLARRVLWANGTPRPQSTASEILGQIMQLDNPFEPLERAAKGLAEAFADPRVQALTEIRGLRTVMSLPPRTENTGRQASDDAVSLRSHAHRRVARPRGNRLGRAAVGGAGSAPSR